MAKPKKGDQAILEGGLGAPIVHGDFRLYEVSIETPSKPDSSTTISAILRTEQVSPVPRL